MTEPSIRAATVADAAALAAIYKPYVLDTTVTFECAPVSVEDMAARVARIQTRFDWLVLERAGRVIGYAYYGPFREREAFAGTVETSLYLAASEQGRGYGRLLYQVLLAAMRARGFREAIACLALPNPASVALHERLGFQPVGRLPRVGYKFGAYVDIGFWQLSLVGT